MKISSMISQSILIGASLAVAACAPPNPKLQAPVELHQEKTQLVSFGKQTSNPKADILFVIDNSMSMSLHQENIKKNVDSFAKAFNANAQMDFHIGVTTVWDSVRFNGLVAPGKFHPLGLLYPIAGTTATPAETFVTRNAGYVQVLAETLKIGVIPRGTGDGGPTDLGGPENEELFTPVRAAIDGRNPGFIRPDAHLAVILITDADDVSSMDPSALRDVLATSKNQDTSMYSTYAILSLSKSCPKDPGNAPPAYPQPNKRILSFLNYTNGKAYDLCSSHFGANLAEVGRLIEQKASRDLKVYLDGIPEIGSLRVVFKGSNQEVANVAYDSHDYVLTIPSSSLEGQPAGTQIEVKYVPVDAATLNSPKSKAVVAPF